MGWEVINGRFFCNTSDTFFGPEFDPDLWPDTDSCDPYTNLWYRCFCEFIPDDPRGMTDRKLAKICDEFHEVFFRINVIQENMDIFVNAFNLSAPWKDSDDLVKFFSEQPLKEETAKPKKTTKKRAKKKTAKKKTAKKKTAKKKTKKKTSKKKK